MKTKGDAWQVHNCGSSNWATGDILEGPKSTPAGRQLVNEKRYRLPLSHTTQCQAPLVTQTVEGSVSDYYCSSSKCVFAPLPLCREAVTVQLARKYRSEKTKGDWQHEVGEQASGPAHELLL